MKILLTGASGFLGQTIVEAHIGEIIGCGRGSKNQISWDLTSIKEKLPKCDMVIHAAGKAHSIPKNAAQSQTFFDVNVSGTENLLRSLDAALPRCFVFISSVAVYGIEEGAKIAEDTPLDGKTPYAQSKILAEDLVNAWGKNKGINVVILRLPLITGKNPPLPLMDLYNAIKSGYYFRIGSGEARKSMVGALDVAALLPTLLEKSGTYNLTDGRHPSINAVDTHIATLLGKKVRSIPVNFMQIAAKIGDRIPLFPLNSLRLKKLNATLTFDDKKAQEELKWDPNPALSYLKFN